MRLGIISDIHANQLALEACLSACQALGVERLICLGDIVGYGADPEAVTQRIMDLAAKGAIVLKGNHDAAISGSSTGMNETAAAVIAWTRPRLSSTSRRFLAELAMMATLDDLLFIHAEASAPERWHYVTGASAAMRSLIATPYRVTFCGHVHVPQLYCMTATAKVVTHKPVAGTEMPLAAQRQWLAVAGAVGQPRDGNPAASFLTYDTDTRILTYRRAPYDHEAAAARVRAAGLPERLAARLLSGT